MKIISHNNFIAIMVLPLVIIAAGSAFSCQSGNSESDTRTIPEPENWYAGDMHVHRSCGGEPIPENTLREKMEENDLGVISLLADMGNAEVLDAEEDLPKVNGSDAPESGEGRIIHWDAEWHWDATYGNFDHQALGGHLVLLGLAEAHQIWDESPYKVAQWARKQNAVVGFAHMQYLDDTIQSELNCCIPIEYPVEIALEVVDFISDDVRGSDSSINAYYRLLNCGFRPGWAAGTDYPCNNEEPFGTLLTYVQIKDQPLTYRAWIHGIADGRTVVSRNGHKEFLEFKVDNGFSPGDEIRFQGKGTLTVSVCWSAVENLNGRVELVHNGKVVASKYGSVGAGTQLTLTTSQEFTGSGWLCARRMGPDGYRLHTAAVYVTVDGAPVRASSRDALFFVDWIDNILEKTSPGGEWNRYFTHDLDVVQERYRRARDVYVNIAKDAQELERQ